MKTNFKNQVPNQLIILVSCVFWFAKNKDLLINDFVEFAVFPMEIKVKVKNI